MKAVLLIVLSVLTFAQAYKEHVSCERDFKKIGCFKRFEEGLEMLITDQDESHELSQNYVLDWSDVTTSFHSLACRCAVKAKENGYRFFSLRFLGECWGSKDEALFNRVVKDKTQLSETCVNGEFEMCDNSHEHECAGEDKGDDYIYLVSQPEEESVNGGYSTWSEYSQCTETCDGGVKIRERTCNNPVPKGNGKDCSEIGEPKESTPCNEFMCSNYLIHSETNLTRDNTLAKLLTMYKVYRVAFDVKPTTFTKSWANVIHFSTGSDMSKYGERNPAVWFHPDGEGFGYLHICSAVSGITNRCVNVKRLPVNQWVNVVITQSLEGGKYMYKVVVNGVTRWNEENKKAEEFKDMYIYTTDPWYESQPGSIKNLLVVNGIAKIQDSENIIYEPKDFILQNEELNLKKGVMVGTLPVLRKEYIVSFEVNPHKYIRGWHNVLHLTVGGNVAVYGDRTPGVWFSYAGDGRMLVSSSVNWSKNRVIYTPKFPLNHWTKVQIAQYLDGKNYRYEVKLDGKIILSQINKSPKDFENVKVYATDKWYPAQPATIRHLFISNGNLVNLIESETVLKKGELVALLPVLQKEYIVTFEVKPSEFKKGWHNVIHFTTGENSNQYGDRNPAVWFHIDGTGRLHIASGINNNRNFYIDSAPVELNKWNLVKISQQLVGEYHEYKINVNGIHVFQTENTKPVELKDVKVFASDPWYPSQPGLIRNLVIASNFRNQKPLHAINKPADIVMIPQELTISKNKLVGTMEKLNKAYEVEFDLKPLSFQSGWHSVLHLTIGGNVAAYGDRNPAIWFSYDASGKITIASAVNNQRNRHIYSPKSLQLKEWSHLRIVQVLENNEYVFKIFVNDELLLSEVNKSPKVFENVKVYAGDPWYAPQDGIIKNLLITNNEEKTLIKESQALKRNNLIAKLPMVRKVYAVSFDVKPTKFVRGWHSVVHFTVGSNYNHYGDRNPAVWFHYNRGGGMHICSGISGNKNKYINTLAVKLNSWSNVKIMQQLIGDDIVYSVEVNGEQILREINHNPKELTNVKVYAADPWYPAQPGYIRNLVVVGM